MFIGSTDIELKVSLIYNLNPSLPLKMEKVTVLW